MNNLINIGVSEIKLLSDIQIGVSEISTGVSEISNGVSEISNEISLINLECEEIINIPPIKVIESIIEIQIEPIIEIKKKYDNIICHYINLDRRADRKIHIEKQLKYFENMFLCERISARDGRKINIQDYVNKKILPPTPRWQGKPFRRGQVACIESHIDSWRKFLKTNKKYLLNLEDDVIINKKYFENMFPKIMKNISGLDFDWLYLGRQCLGYTAFYSGPVVKTHYYIPQTLGFGAHSYILSRDGAKNMIKYYTSRKLSGNIQYNMVTIPLDIMDSHKIFYKRIMRKQLKIFSILPEGFDKKRKISRGKAIHSKSNDFFFFSKDWSDSDTAFK